VDVKNLTRRTASRLIGEVGLERETGLEPATSSLAFVPLRRTPTICNHRDSTTCPKTPLNGVSGQRFLRGTDSGGPRPGDRRSARLRSPTDQALSSEIIWREKARLKAVIAVTGSCFRPPIAHPENPRAEDRRISPVIMRRDFFNSGSAVSPASKFRLNVCF
jgi:hypothetical protein